MEDSTIFWIFGVFALISAVLASFSSNYKLAGLAIWICSFAMGSAYITLGAEFLGFMQWIVGTVVAASFLFYSIVFGFEEQKLKWTSVLAAGVLSALMVFYVQQGIQGMPMVHVDAQGSEGLSGLGEAMLSRHFLAYLVSSVIMLLAIMGAGVTSRVDER